MPRIARRCERLIMPRPVPLLPMSGRLWPGVGAHLMEYDDRPDCRIDQAGAQDAQPEANRYESFDDTHDDRAHKERHEHSDAITLFPGVLLVGHEPTVPNGLSLKPSDHAAGRVATLDRICRWAGRYGSRTVSSSEDGGVAAVITGRRRPRTCACAERGRRRGN
jgi:hypothetical protein